MSNLKPDVPLISVCIPLFESENYLHQCLMSVLLQNTDDFEVVIVNDASHGKDDKGQNAKKIISIAHKEAEKIRKASSLKSVYVNYIEHDENRGLIEARRTLIYESRAQYITMLDSDDVDETSFPISVCGFNWEPENLYDENHELIYDKTVEYDPNAEEGNHGLII